VVWSISCLRIASGGGRLSKFHEDSPQQTAIDFDLPLEALQFAAQLPKEIGLLPAFGVDREPCFHGDRRLRCDTRRLPEERPLLPGTRKPPGELLPTLLDMLHLLAMALDGDPVLPALGGAVGQHQETVYEIIGLLDEHGDLTKAVRSVGGGKTAAGDSGRRVDDRIPLAAHAIQLLFTGQVHALLEQGDAGFERSDLCFGLLSLTV
jgi:hypothetical protein